MTKAIVPANPKKLKFIATAILKETEKVARIYYANELTQVVAPFESDVKVVVTTVDEGGNKHVRIHGQKGDSATVNAGGDSVSSHDLIKFLDGGTSYKTVQMPDDFGNESFTNSLGTRNVDYDRDMIFFSNQTQQGIAPRNWLTLINEMYKNTIRLNINRVVKAYINS